MVDSRSRVSKDDHKRGQRSCRLVVRHRGRPCMFFEVQVYDTALVADKLVSKRIDTFKSADGKATRTFMTHLGVPGTEIDAAVDQLDVHDHNVACFGFFGGFITSHSDEMLQ